MFNKIRILFRCIYGYLIKWQIDCLGIRGIQKLSQQNDSLSPCLTVSLTSYGRRVKNNIVYYTIVSLLRQTKRPNRIILWLDELKWNENNLPKRLNSLREYGVEILFCKDLKSYTKLIPTLQKYSNDIIVTVDDDVYYSSRLLEILYNGYLQDSSQIYCIRGLEPKFDMEGHILSYNKWEIQPRVNSPYLFPMGVGGVLYPPFALYSDTCNENLFLKLSPYGDDLWFWMMALKQKTSRCLLPFNWQRNYPLDTLYQYFHKGSALAHINTQQCFNDEQLAKILKYYGIKKKKDFL